MLQTKQKVLIVSPPYRLSASDLPLGLAYIAAVLRKRGHPVEVIDMDVKNYSAKEYAQLLRVKEYSILCLGGMITTWNFFKFTCHYVKKIKPHVKIVIGGGIISSSPHSFLSIAPADVGVIGEGEDRILDLMEAFEGVRPIGDVASIVYRENEITIQTKQGPQIHNLDLLPFPAWDLFDVANTYACDPSQSSLFKTKRRMAITTSRGCPFQCTFCYTEKKVRYRSIENVLAEMAELKARYHISHFDITDNLFVTQKKRVVEFCEALIRRKFKVTWNANGRSNLADAELYKLMRAAGCIELGLGIESGSLAILKSIKKQQTPEQIIHAVKIAERAGIRAGGTFILGLPSETQETVRETVAVYKAINNHRKIFVSFFFATPYPGTELYNEMKKKSRIPDEFHFFEKLSQKGDATDLVINCTDAFSDKQLIQTKMDVEAEVFRDFSRKHPLLAFLDFLNQKTIWGKIRAVLIRAKLRGMKQTIQFLSIKLKAKCGLMPDPYVRRWAKIQAPSEDQF